MFGLLVESDGGGRSRTLRAVGGGGPIGDVERLDLHELARSRRLDAHLAFGAGVESLDGPADRASAVIVRRNAQRSARRFDVKFRARRRCVGYQPSVLHGRDRRQR
jgi:hypothetical protein